MREPAVVVHLAEEDDVAERVLHTITKSVHGREEERGGGERTYTASMITVLRRSARTAPTRLQRSPMSQTITKATESPSPDLRL